MAGVESRNLCPREMNRETGLSSVRKLGHQHQTRSMTMVVMGAFKTEFISGPSHL